jgi:hypothetical protein
VITDYFIQMFLPLVEFFIGVLPEGTDGLELPVVEQLVVRMYELDSLVPIAKPMLLVLGLLPLALGFILFRFVVFLRHFLLP